MSESRVQGKQADPCLPVVDGMIGQGVRFERIRRITGYLVGTLDRFNDAKGAEVGDRIKQTGSGAGMEKWGAGTPGEGGGYGPANR